MISRSDLHEAKAFLCWDVFENLSVQLVALQDAAAFYFPPQNHLHSIVLFYNDDCDDFSEPLFMLFHEAGHVKQFDKLGIPKKYDEFLQAPNGRRRMTFEQQAWDEALILFKQFIDKKAELDKGMLLSAFYDYSHLCIRSYASSAE